MIAGVTPGAGVDVAVVDTGLGVGVGGDGVGVLGCGLGVAGSGMGKGVVEFCAGGSGVGVVVFLHTDPSHVVPDTKNRARQKYIYIYITPLRNMERTAARGSAT